MIAKRSAACMILMSALCVTGVAAQDRVTTVGVLGGVNFATFTGDIIGNAETKVGFDLGGYVSFGISRNFAIETGALYSQRGAKVSEQGVTVKFKVNYIEVPLLLSARFPGQSAVTPFISAGPAVGIKVGCGVSVSGGGATFGSGCQGVEDALDSDLKSTDFGLVGTVGIDVRALRFSLRYFRGLSSIANVEPASVKNSVFSFLVGYGFRLR